MQASNRSFTILLVDSCICGSIKTLCVGRFQAGYTITRLYASIKAVILDLYALFVGFDYLKSTRTLAIIPVAVCGDNEWQSCL